MTKEDEKVQEKKDEMDENREDNVGEEKEKEDGDDEEEKEIEERNSYKIMVDENNENMIDCDNANDDSDPVNKEIDANSTQLSCFTIVSITITSHTATCWSYCYRKSGFKLSDSIRRSCRSYF